MGDEQKPQASFLARKNAGAGAAGAGAASAPVPGAPVIPPRAAPPPPSIPTMGATVPQHPSTFLKPKATLGSIAGTSALNSGMRSATMQSGKLMIPGAKSALLPVNVSQKLSAIRPGFAPSAGAPGKGTLAPNNVIRSATQNVSALLPGYANPAQSAMTQTAPIGLAIQQMQRAEAEVAPPTPAPAPALVAQRAAHQGSRAEAEQILQAGLDHYDRGEYEMALEAYNEAIQADPTFAMAYNNLGMVMIDLERYQDAMNALYESIRHDANYGEAYNNLGFVLRRLGNNLDAASAYQRFLNLEPDVDEGERISAWIETVLAENGMDAPPSLILPEAPQMSGEDYRADAPNVQPKIKKMAAWEAAAGDVATAAPVNALGEIEDRAEPSYAPQKTNMLGAHESLVTQRHPTLIAAPTPKRQPGAPLTEEDRNRQIALIEKSLDEFANGNLDDAQNLAQEAVEIDQQNSEAHTALGKILVRKELLKEGIEQLELAIQLAPDDPAPHYVLGFTLRAMERNVEAAEIYETFLRLMPDAIDAPKMRQWIMHVKGIAEAVAAPDREDEGFMDEEPIVTETDKMYSAALERFKTCTPAQTIDDCERILAEDPNHARTRILIGRAFMRDGEFEKATEHFQSALEMRPDCFEALFYIGQSYEKSGDSPHALKAYRRYVEENPEGPRVEKLRAWFLSHGVADTGRGLSEQVQCEWCLRFFEDSEISLHEGKTTCNGCLTLMGSTPIRDANKLEIVDTAVTLPKRDSARRSGGSQLLKLAAFAMTTAAALVALGYFTPLLDPYLKMAGIVKKKPAPIARALPPIQTEPDGAEKNAVPGTVASGSTAPIEATGPKQVLAPPPTLSPRFDGTKVKIANVPEKDFSVFSRWTWKPELEGIEELDQSVPGWKKEIFFSKEHPAGMSVEDGTIVWSSESKDFEALKKGERFPVELTVKGYWIGPEGARRDLFSTVKSFVVSSQFGYELGPELDIGVAPNARNVELLGIDADGDGLRDVIVTHGSLNQGSAQTVLCGPEGAKQTIELATGGRFSSACAFPLNGKENAGVLAANWQTGEVKLFLLKGGRLEAGPSVKFPAGVLSVAAMETGRNKTAIAALSSTAGTLSMSIYEEGKGFGKPGSVALPGGGGNGRVLAWKSADLGPGFLAVTPLADEPLRFVRCGNGEWEKGASAIRSGVDDQGMITGAAQVACASNGSHRLALVLGATSSHLMLLEEKAGKFSAVGTKTLLPGPGLGLTVWDFNQDGNDDLFVVTRDEVCFFFLNEVGGMMAGPRFSNPGMLGPVVLLGYGNSARPDIAVLNDNKKARVFKPVGNDHAAAPVKPAVGLAP